MFIYNWCQIFWNLVTWNLTLETLITCDTWDTALITLLTIENNIIKNYFVTFELRVNWVLEMFKCKQTIVTTMSDHPVGWQEVFSPPRRRCKFSRRELETWEKYKELKPVHCVYPLCEPGTKFFSNVYNLIEVFSTVCTKNKIFLHCLYRQ